MKVVKHNWSFVVRVVRVMPAKHSHVCAYVTRQCGRGKALGSEELCPFFFPNSLVHSFLAMFALTSWGWHLCSYFIVAIFLACHFFFLVIFYFSVLTSFISSPDVFRPKRSNNNLEITILFRTRYLRVCVYNAPGWRRGKKIISWKNVRLNLFWYCFVPGMIRSSYRFIYLFFASW